MRRLPRIAVIGAGLAGLTCARELSAQGLAPVVFDKGRGLGGRLSTRRAEGGLQFDHGAQYLTAESGGFASLLRDAEAAGAVARWPLDRKEPAFVGVPGMTGLAKFLSDGLNIRKGVRITQIRKSGDRWKLSWHGGEDHFDRVVITAPAPQTAALVPKDHSFRCSLETVDMDPCLALMVTLPPDADLSFTTWYDPSGHLSWIALDSAKPGRSKAPCLVAHASSDWSLRHLELEMHEIKRHMLPLISEVLGTQLTYDLPYVAAHRWRYALVAKPLGTSFLADTGQSLLAGGDWCLGNRAEDAWTSGKAIAQALIRSI